MATSSKHAAQYSTSTPQYLTLRKSYRLLVTHITAQTGEFCDSLFEGGYISSSVRNYVRIDALSEDKKAQRLMDTMIDKVESDVTVFYGFMDILKRGGPPANDIVAQLEEHFEKEQATLAGDNIPMSEPTNAYQTVVFHGQDKESQVTDWASLRKSPRPMLNIPLVSDNMDDGYVKFTTLQSLQPQGSSSIASTFGTSDLKQESSPDSSDDHIYEQLPYERILQIMPSEPKPLVEEKIRLLVRPFRQMIEKRKQETVCTENIPARHHYITNTSFQLRISTGSLISPESTSRKRTNVAPNRFISGDLYLISDTTFPDSCFLQAHIQVLLPRRHKQKMLTLHHGCNKKQKCISEQAVLLDLPTTHQFGEPVAMQAHKPLCVATFPNLMSHRNFMNDKLVCTNYISINLFVREI